MRLIPLLCAVLWAAGAAAGTPADLCDGAIAEASRRTGVPPSVLEAIALTETGKKVEGKLRAWPWTVNMEGAGKWFDQPDEARAYVFKEFKRGARSFDVGCFQLNYKWHGEGFDSIDQMFDPLANSLYAANFLKDLYGEFGDWTKAAGAYHSRTPEFAKKYAARFAALHARVAANADAADLGPREPGVVTAPAPGEAEIPQIPDVVLAMNQPAAAPAPRQNLYPLLQPGAAGAMGSLVPLGASRGSFLQ